ncbi:MAG: SPOR domain-containing protein [Deltaproteobacteria bacterium]|nr:SPOR domain-containing protein [Deltaproteobacteria bacterium]
MARIRKKSRKIQFQISWGGLVALAISTVCVFLWVFILGFWVGQKLVGRSLDESLQTQVVARTVPEAEEATPLIPEKITRVTPLDTKEKEQPEPRKKLVKKKVRGTDDIKKPGHQIKKTKKKGSYFALQIASYRERERANKEAGRWRDKGYRAKVRRIELGPEKVIWYRVHLGEYGSVEEATNFAKNLAQKHNLRSYVVPIRN